MDYGPELELELEIPGALLGDGPELELELDSLTDGQTN